MDIGAIWIAASLVGTTSGVLNSDSINLSKTAQMSGYSIQANVAQISSGSAAAMKETAVTIASPLASASLISQTSTAQTITSSPSAVTVASATDINTETEVITKTAHGYSNGQRGQFTTSDTLPTGISALTDYFIVEKTDDTFKVSATLGGVAVDITAAGTGNQTFTPNSPIDLTSNVITKTAHGFANATRLQVTTSGGLPTGISALTDYFVVNATADTFKISASEGGAAVDITAAGTGNQTFTPNKPVDVAGDKLFSASHNLTDTTIGRFTTTGTLPTGLSTATTYYIVGSTANDFQVSLTEGGAAVNITGVGSGTHTFVPTLGINPVTDTMTSNGHGYLNGYRGRFTTSGTLPGGLEADTDYYVVNKATNTFQVSSTIGGAAIDLTDGGTGNQTFTPNMINVDDDTFFFASHGFVDGLVLQVANAGGGLPTGISALTNYYVINSSTNSFQLSASDGGAALDVTVVGTGTQTFTPTANLVGTIKTQMSLDNINWVDVTSGSQNVSVSGVGTATLIWNASDIPYDYVRLVWTKTSGNGTVTAKYRVKKY